MEEFWKDINHVPLVNSHSVSCSSSSCAPPPYSTASELHEFFITQPLRIDSSSSSTTAAATDPTGFAASLFPSSSNKRLSDPHGDRRSKRMIKNRESAARSRARKQAYTNELEQKLALLKEENAMLMKQLEQLDEAPANDKNKLKKPPYRTLTAPF